MHDRMRRAAQQESFKTLPPMRAVHDEVVVLTLFAHNSHGITLSDIGRHCEVRAGQHLNRVGYNLFSMPLIFLRPGL